MKRWEYCLVKLTYPDTRRAREGKVSVRLKDGSKEYGLGGDGAFIDTIDKLGEDGWEAVESSSHFGIVQYIFKRPKQSVIPLEDKHSILEISPELSREIKERVNELQEKIIESYTKSD